MKEKENLLLDRCQKLVSSTDQKGQDSAVGLGKTCQDSSTDQNWSVEGTVDSCFGNEYQY
jgi:hypothetical protein